MNQPKQVSSLIHTKESMLLFLCELLEKLKECEDEDSVDKSDPERIDEPDPERIDEADPERIDEADPERIDEADPEYIDEPDYNELSEAVSQMNFKKLRKAKNFENLLKLLCFIAKLRYHRYLIVKFAKKRSK